MKKLKLIAWAVLIGALSTAATWAQVKGVSTTRWRIVDGPGAGNLLIGNGGSINASDNPATGASGFIAAAHLPFCGCDHYHGSLYGKEDNDEGCGWGCVVQQPVTPSQALATVRDEITRSTTNTALRNKLNTIIDTAEVARSTDCNTLFENAIDAVADELFGAIETGAVTLEDATGLVQALVDYVVVALDDIAPPFPPPPPPPKPCKVSLMLRHGSGAQSKLFDAKRKVNADVAEVVTFDAQGCPEGGAYEWEYKFKGQAKGDVPGGAGISYTTQRFCVLSERATTVTVIVIYHCPDGKMVKDTATVSIQ